MHTIDPNGTNNHRWHLAHGIRTTIASMSDDQKQQVLSTIETKRACCDFLETQYNKEVYNYITSLLNNQKPRVGISRR